MTMEVLRKVVEINNNRLDLKLPVTFDTKFVEIIILPFYENDMVGQTNEKTDKVTNFQSLLLSAPVMTDEDYNFFLMKKQDFKLATLNKKDFDRIRNLELITR